MRLMLGGLALVLGGLAGVILAGSAAVLPIFAALVAVLLPAAGLAALVKEKAPPEAGLLLWAAVVIVGAPVWVDREAALAEVGLADLEGILPSLHRPGPAAFEDDPPESPRPDPIPPPPIDADADDLVVLPYEGTARSMLLTINLESEDVVLETEMVFDTGATLTTVSPKLLDELDIDVPDDAPTITLQTANGTRQSPLLLLDRLWLGGFAVEGVSVSVCDNCGDLNGLIGLNVSSMFRVEVDQQNRELTFHPRDGDRHLDITHWLKLGLTRGRGGLSVTATNRSPRTVTGAVFEGDCGDGVATARLDPILPGEAMSAVFDGPLPCQRPKISLMQAVW